MDDMKHHKFTSDCLMYEERELLRKQFFQSLADIQGKVEARGNAVDSECRCSRLENMDRIRNRLIIMKQFLQACRADLFLYDENMEELQTFMTTGYNENNTAQAITRIAGMVFNSAKTTVIDSLAEYFISPLSEDSESNPVRGSLVAYRLVSDETVLGLLVVYKKTIRGFNSDNLITVVQYANEMTEMLMSFKQ